MKKIAIIGGGLAGTACAYVLKRAGLTPVIYEASKALASGASGNALGLYNPRLGALFTPESEYYAGAFTLARETFESLSGIAFNPCGALHLMCDEKRRNRFTQMAESWPWGEEDMRLVSANEASQIAGVALDYGALYLPRSGTISPRALCAAYAQGVEVHLNTRVDNLGAIEADAIILACGLGVESFVPGLPLQDVRGQVTYVKETESSSALQSCLCYGGHMAPAQEGQHCIGSTFQRWDRDERVRDEDDQLNVHNAKSILGDIVNDGVGVVGRRAGVRVAAKDQFPIVGAVPGDVAGVENVYISLAHGSYGLVSSLMAAQLLTDMILGQDLSLPDHVTERFNPARFK